MSRNLQSMVLPKEIQARTEKRIEFWENPKFLGKQKRPPADSHFKAGFRYLKAFPNSLGLQRPNSNSTQRFLNNQAGFAQAFFISLIPIFIAGVLVLLLSQFILKNWSQSLHTCRVELLSSQKKTKNYLKQLLNLNALAKSLRIALGAAQAQLAIAIATQNGPMAAKATEEIARIQSRQKQLDVHQRYLIFQASMQMNKGVESVVRKLRQQSFSLQKKLPKGLSFRIHSIHSYPKLLAVQPDRPEVAPVYKLHRQFQSQQALHVSWISEFQIQPREKNAWIRNYHRKQDGCGASLKNGAKDFQEVLHEDKLSLRPWSSSFF